MKAKRRPPQPHGGLPAAAAAALRTRSLEQLTETAPSPTAKPAAGLTETGGGGFSPFMCAGVTMHQGATSGDGGGGGGPKEQCPRTTAAVTQGEETTGGPRPPLPPDCCTSAAASAAPHLRCSRTLRGELRRHQRCVASCSKRPTAVVAAEGGEENETEVKK
ncbi:hypothetical protein FOCC_FOCC000013 [Frankliniella occidentalis]|nr:hypothetical protein FOCC_FOCC000013 [Frankliniella occidentalis]